MQGSNRIFNSFRHCIHFALLRKVLATGHSIHGGFHSGEVLVVILVQCIYFGNRCINLGVVSVLVLQGSNRIFNSLRHCVNFRLFGNVFVTDNSLQCIIHSGEILVVVLVQSIYLGNGCVYFGVISTLVLQGGNCILDSLCHCINLCLLGFTFCSVNSINGIFYRRIICIKAAIKSLCTCDGRINSCVISGNVIVIPHKSWIADSGTPLNARTGIGSQASKDICGGKVCDGSTLLFVALSSSIRKRRRVICFRVIRPVAIFYRAIEGISHPTSISIFIYAHVSRRNHTVIDCSQAPLVIRIPNDSANSGLKGVDNNLTIKPTIRNR